MRGGLAKSDDEAKTLITDSAISALLQVKCVGAEIA